MSTESAKKSILKKAVKAVKKTREKVVDKTADILSAPARALSSYKMKKSEQIVKDYNEGKKAIDALDPRSKNNQDSYVTRMEKHAIGAMDHSNYNPPELPAVEKALDSIDKIRTKSNGGNMTSWKSARRYGVN